MTLIINSFWKKISKYIVVFTYYKLIRNAVSIDPRFEFCIL